MGKSASNVEVRESGGVLVAPVSWSMLTAILHLEKMAKKLV